MKEPSVYSAYIQISNAITALRHSERGLLDIMLANGFDDSNIKLAIKMHSHQLNDVETTLRVVRSWLDEISAKL